MDSPVYEIFPGKSMEWVAISFSRDLSDPGIEPGSPTLQADTLRLSHQSLRPTYVWHLKKEKNPTEAQPSAL